MRRRRVDVQGFAAITTFPRLIIGQGARWISPQSVTISITVALLLSVVFAYVAGYYAGNGAFPGVFDLTSILDNALPLILVSMGQAIVVLTGGLDLSVGGTVDVTNVIAARYMTHSWTSLLLTMLAIIVVGAVIGWINGSLIVYGRQPAIIVTLGMLAILQGLALWVSPEPGGALPPIVTDILANPDKPSSILVILLTGIAWGILRRTRFGTSIYAIGNDRKAARAGGIHISRMIIWAYIASGIFSAVGGLFLAATTTGGDPRNGNIFTLTSLAAVIIGGVSLTGGRGSPVGALLGSLIVTLLTGLLIVLRLNPLYASLWQGVLLLGAVTLAVLLQRLYTRWSLSSRTH